jgi:hypothetical protein
MARYKRSQADAGISLECETERVPADGRYHVLRGEEIVSSHKGLKAGTAAYLALLDELGFSAKPPAPAPQASTEEASSSRLYGDFYVYGKSKRRKTGTRTFG